MVAPPLNLARHYLYLQPHPVYGSFHIPSTTSWLWTDEYITRVDINSHGLREREIQYEKPAGVRRVVIVGDSFVEGSEVPAEATIGRRLETLLNTDRGETVEVINAGVLGYGTTQEYLLIENEALRYQPDVVILVFFPGNDLADNSYQIMPRSRPYYTLTESGELSPLPFRPEPQLTEGWRDRLSRESLLFSKLEMVDFARLRSQDEARRRSDAQYAVGPFATNLTEQFEESWRVTEALLVRTQGETEAAGTRFLLVNAPTPFEVYPEHWQNVLERAGLPDVGWNLDGPNSRLAEIARRHGMLYVDLRSPLRSAADGGPRLYYPYDGHWTAAGHNTAAQTLATTLHQERLLDASGAAH
jgi:hypothetical protein